MKKINKGAKTVTIRSDGVEDFDAQYTEFKARKENDANKSVGLDQSVTFTLIFVRKPTHFVWALDYVLID